MDVLIRDEMQADISQITELTKAAFADCKHGNHTEQFIIIALRKADALSVSLVAELDGKVVGHIAFSPVTISDGTDGWYGLGPISVSPELQRRGIGSKLINAGLDAIKALDAKGCVLVGDPNYYTRFGFINPSGLTIEGVPPDVLFTLSFDDNQPVENLMFHEAFFVQE